MGKSPAEVLHIDYVSKALQTAYDRLNEIVPEDEFEGIGTPDSTHHDLRKARERCAQALPVAKAQWQVVQAARVPTLTDHTRPDGTLWHEHMAAAIDDLDDAVLEDSISDIVLEMQRRRG